MSQVHAVDGSTFSSTYLCSESVNHTKDSDISFQSFLDKESSNSHIRTSSSLDRIFYQAADTYGIDVDLLKAVAKTESNFQSHATSSSGAMGIMQLMPQTAKSLGVHNAYDPEQNIMGGAKLLASHLKKYNGNVSLALAAYNAGSGAVDSYGGIPPYSQTRKYVANILKDYKKGSYSTSEPSSSKSAASSKVSPASENEVIPIKGEEIVKDKKELEIDAELKNYQSNDIYLTSNTNETIVSGAAEVSAPQTKDTSLQNASEVTLSLGQTDSEQTASSKTNYQSYTDSYLNLLSSLSLNSISDNYTANLLGSTTDDTTGITSPLLSILQSTLASQTKKES